MRRRSFPDPAAGPATCGKQAAPAADACPFRADSDLESAHGRTTMTYQAPVSDIAFALKHAARFSAAREDGVYDLTDDLLHAVLEEAGKFASNIIAPLNRVGDQHGTPFKDGVVTTPPGWKEAYPGWAEAGWNGLSSPAEWGGQGLPHAANAARIE